LQYFSKIYSGTKYKIDSVGKEYFALPDSDLLSRNWWDILKSLKTEPTFKNMSGFMGLYVWESFVGWCFEDETARKAFNIELKKEKEEKKEEVEFTITIPDNQTVAHIPSVKLSKASGTQNKPKERKLNRIKTHSGLVKCTNKSRRIESVLSTSVTCGHCLKIGKKKGLWV
jgi:hypothetical protein